MNFNGASLGQTVLVDDNEGEDDVVGMINNVEKELLDHHEKIERLLGDAEKPFTLVIKTTS